MCIQFSWHRKVVRTGDGAEWQASRSGSFIPRTVEVDSASAFNRTPSIQCQINKIAGTKFTK
jgi:hypothetical protein